ncbi:MAG: GNAT family N-acetyltransferase [bacterium]
MDDRNRLFALRKLAETELKIAAAAGEMRDFGWCRLAVSQRFPFYSPGWAVFPQFAPGEGDAAKDLESVIGSIAPEMKSCGASGLRVVFSPELTGDYLAKNLSEDLFLLDFKQEIRDVYAWVKAKKPASQPGIEIRAASSDWEAAAPAFEEPESPMPAADRMAIHRMRDGNLPGYKTLIAFLNGAPAGRMAYFNDGVAGRLHGLYVLPGFRRKGVATALMDAGLAAARDAGNIVIGVIARRESPARFLYVDFGFAKIGEIAIYEGKAPL